MFQDLFYFAKCDCGKHEAQNFRFQSIRRSKSSMNSKNRSFFVFCFIFCLKFKIYFPSLKNGAIKFAHNLLRGWQQRLPHSKTPPLETVEVRQAITFPVPRFLPRLEQLAVLVDEIADVTEQFLERGPQMRVQIEARLHQAFVDFAILLGQAQSGR